MWDWLHGVLKGFEAIFLNLIMIKNENVFADEIIEICDGRTDKMPYPIFFKLGILGLPDTSWNKGGNDTQFNKGVIEPEDAISKYGWDQVSYALTHYYDLMHWIAIFSHHLGLSQSYLQQRDKAAETKKEYGAIYGEIKGHFRPDKTHEDIADIQPTQADRVEFWANKCNASILKPCGYKADSFDKPHLGLSITNRSPKIKSRYGAGSKIKYVMKMTTAENSRLKAFKEQSKAKRDKQKDKNKAKVKKFRDGKKFN